MSKAQPAPKVPNAPKVPAEMPPHESRTIRIVGAIDEDAYLAFSEEMAALEADYSLKPIHIELNSYGGEPSMGLAIADRVRCSSCPVHVSVYGEASSAATAILAAGDYRSMSPYATALVHDNSFKFKGNNSQMQAHARQAEVDEEVWAEMLASTTLAPYETWRSLSAKSTLLNAQQCLQLGLVDYILKGKKRANSLR